MRCSSRRPFSLVLGLGLALACSSASRESEPDTEPVLETAEHEPHAPVVGEPAPALALDSLSGTRVQLPASASGHAKRASVLIFGSFS